MQTICDCCEGSFTVLYEMPSFSVVLTESPKPTLAEIRSAPRRPCLWCARCKLEHERWAKPQAAIRRKYPTVPQPSKEGAKAA